MKNRRVFVKPNTYLLAVGGDLLPDSDFENEAPEPDFGPETIVLVTPEREN